MRVGGPDNGQVPPDPHKLGRQLYVTRNEQRIRQYAVVIAPPKLSFGRERGSYAF